MIFGPRHVKNWKPQYEYMITVCSKIYLLLLPKVCELIFSRWPRHVDRLLRTTITVDDVGCTATCNCNKIQLTIWFHQSKTTKQQTQTTPISCSKKASRFVLVQKISKCKNPYCTSNTNRSTADSIKLFHKVSIRNNKSIVSETCNLTNVYSLYIAQKGHWLTHIKYEG